MKSVKLLKNLSLFAQSLFIVLVACLAKPASANGCGSNIVVCSHSGSYGDINATRAADLRAKLSNADLFGPAGSLMPETFSFVSIPTISATELANNSCHIYFSGYDTDSQIDATEQAALNTWVNAGSDRYILSGCDSSSNDSVCAALNRPVVNYPNTPVELVDNFPPNPMLCSGGSEAEISGGASSYFTDIGSDVVLARYDDGSELIEAITDSLTGNGKYLLTGDINMWVTPNSSISSGPDISLNNDYFIINTFKFAADNICGRVNSVTGTHCPTSFDPTDYSDAPASYGSPNHRITPDVYLGTTVPDSEAGPQASVDATADGLNGTDDEDGIAPFATLTTGANETISVTANGAGAYLQAWIDWNGDGDFADSGEQIATDLQLTSGTTGVINIPFVVPADAAIGQTFARLRLSNTAGLNSLVGANDGEVEDYILTIQQATNNDSDGDGISNADEATLGTDPEDADTDNDGISDGDELNGPDGDPTTTTDNTNPLDADSDDDGLSDGDELNGPDGDPATIADNTDPNNPDSDADGLQDGTESGVATPLTGGNSDGTSSVTFAGTDSTVQVLDADPATTTDPNNPDSDSGGVCDGNNTVTGTCVAGEDTNNNGNVDNAETNPLLSSDDAGQNVELQLRAMLHGPYNQSLGLMNDALREQGLLPVQQPYNITPVEYAGVEQLAGSVSQVTGSDAVVDWVLAELRDATDASLVVAAKAMMIQRDGDVVDSATGDTSWRPLGVNAGNYYVTLRHRNHLDVMTRTAITLSNNTSTLIDFSLTATQVRGDNTRFELNDQAFMYAGDANIDQRAIGNGPDQDATILLSGVLLEPDNQDFNANHIRQGYYATDLNLDGKTLFSGPDNDTNILLISVLLHPENSGFAANYIINGCMEASNMP